MSNLEIEDVLSSIRRLVSEDSSAGGRFSAARAKDRALNSKFVLTPAFRVSEQDMREMDMQEPAARFSAPPRAEIAPKDTRDAPSFETALDDTPSVPRPTEHRPRIHFDAETADRGQDGDAADAEKADGFDRTGSAQPSDSMDGDALSALVLGAADRHDDRDMGVDPDDAPAAEAGGEAIAQTAANASDNDDASWGASDEVDTAETMRTQDEPLTEDLSQIGAFFQKRDPAPAVAPFQKPGQTRANGQANGWEPELGAPDLAQEMSNGASNGNIHSFFQRHISRLDDGSHHPNETAAAQVPADHAASDSAASEFSEPVNFATHDVMDDELDAVLAQDDYFNDELLDEEALRDIITQIIREELQGQLGERITRNVKRLVRREVQRALTLKDFD